VSRAEPDELAGALALRLARLVNKPIELRLTDNRRTMISWSTRAGVVRLRLHHMFAEAPEPVVEALAATLAGRGRAAGRVLDAFIESNRGAIRKGRRTPRLRPSGRCHDLAEILAEINAQLLGGAFDGHVGWGRATGARRRRSIRLGSYSHADRLIRIHPALDQPFVPRYVIEWVMHHEMLHQLVPCARSGRRRRCHSAEFRAREATFPDHARAAAWEKENLHRLLRYHGGGAESATTK
jgi:hypothetical protein